MNAKRYLKLLAVALMPVFGMVVMFGTLLGVQNPARAASTATDRYVAASAGEDAGTCTKDSPCRTIQYAIAQANPGDTLIITGGTYTGTVEVTKTITFEGGYTHFCLPDCVWLRPSCNPSSTVLDGLQAGRVISISLGVAVTSNCLTIANGDATGLGGSVYGGDAGGGVYARWPSSVLISNAVITNNTASRSGYGGGVYVHGGPLVLSNTRVVSNVAHIGGGVYLVGAGSSVIENSDIVENTAWGGLAGGVYLGGYSNNAKILASTFLTNSAVSGGGLMAHNSKVVVTDSLFSGNSVGDSGGGIAISWSSGSRIQNNAIFSNEATQDGGGIYLYGAMSSPPLISGNSITNNQSTRGGGVYLGDNTQAETVFSENRISANSADYGGGLYLENSHSFLRNNLIFGNSASYSGGGSGGGVYVDGGTSRMVHNTLARNSSGGWGSGVHVVQAATAWLTNTILVGYPDNNYASGIYVGTGATATLQATLWGIGSWAYKHDWVGTGTIITGTVNVWDDPGFVNPSGNDYHLAEGSAAIDAGVDAGVATDIDGQSRDASPDIGADEFVPSMQFIYLPLILRQ